jgi:hypothetical protein
MTGSRLKQIIKEELSRAVNEGWRAMTPVESMVNYFFRFPEFEARLGLRPHDYRDPGLHKRIAMWLKRSDDFSGYEPEEYDEAAMEIALKLSDQFRGSEEGRAAFKRMKSHYERDIENPYGPESDY